MSEDEYELALALSASIADPSQLKEMEEKERVSKEEQEEQDRLFALQLQEEDQNSSNSTNLQSIKNLFGQRIDHVLEKESEQQRIEQETNPPIDFDHLLATQLQLEESKRSNPRYSSRISRSPSYTPPSPSPSPSSSSFNPARPPPNFLPFNSPSYLPSITPDSPHFPPTPILFHPFFARRFFQSYGHPSSNEEMNYETLLALSERLGSANVGLTEAEISTLQEVEFVKQESEQCSICLSEIERGFTKFLKKKKKLIYFLLLNLGDNVIYTPCLHIFHPNCITTWLEQKNSCPICKASILNK